MTTKPHPDKPTDTKTTHGGKRAGAGRKTPASPYGEKTKVMRIPESKVTLVKDWLAQNATTPTITTQSSKTNNPKQPGLVLPSDIKNADVYRIEPRTDLALNLYSHKVVAGFPSPADDNIEQTIDLNTHFIKHPDTTFLVQVQGDSMKNAGIHHGDYLAVDRSITPKDKSIVIAAIDGELTVKRLSIKSTGTWLMPENDDYDPIPVKEENDLTIWGVVVSVLRNIS